MGVSVAEASRTAERVRTGGKTSAVEDAPFAGAGRAIDSLPVAVLTPTGQDSRVAEKVLARVGLDPRVCETMADVCELIRKEEIGMLLMAEEALAPEARDKLFASLDQQPSWSDVPIVILTGEDELSGALPRTLSGVAQKGNVTLLERPVRVATLTTVIRSALRARQRQLDVKANLEQRHAAEVSLRQSEMQLRAAVQSAPYPLMLHASDGEILQLSEAWMKLTGYYSTPVTTTDEWAQLAFSDEGQDSILPHGSIEIDQAEGESVRLGEHKVRTADGKDRTWDFHRVALGTLPDGRRLWLTAAIDVTEYKQLVESERSARQEAEEANAAKSQFLATMSHELRTPLNAIAGYSELLKLELRGPITPEQREDLERIDRSQRHLLSLINDVLNFAKIEAGHVAVESKPMGLGQVIESLRGFVEPQLREKSLRFKMAEDFPTAEACGDPDKVRQILINLLSNAIKFTPENGTIELLCHDDEKMLYLCVTDTGSGIPRDKLEAIFEPFVQVNRDYASKHEGTGLGLSISRDLARRMGGDITVKSELGKGSEFVLSLPKA
ncbi:MAG TPA: ATP-binding protein [Gemmatimonadaceae bacterium]|nr:ATP-binding protein [Gemmatimonadaceae bacterium]